MNHINQLINIKENPFILFDKWFEEAKVKEINDPNAMNLATVNKNLHPSSRIVLLKSHGNSGFVFYTNLKSRKGISISNNANVSLNFHWKSLLRQVRIEGVANLVSNNEADEYFDTRLENSRIGAWASHQSSVLSDRKELEYKIKNFKDRFEGHKIPRPSYWSGYRVKPNLIEFWQQMPFRLHDRVEFVVSKKEWIGKRLYP